MFRINSFTQRLHIGFGYKFRSMFISSTVVQAQPSLGSMAVCEKCEVNFVIA